MFDPDRFLDAQAQSYTAALAEISAGAKRSHWMWYIFPQVVGLGHSPMAQRYVLASVDEARAYLAHPVLGQRLHDCVSALQGLPHADAQNVFGPVDAMKLRSSLTLFIEAGAGRQFEAALDRWFDGEADPLTKQILNLQLGR